MYPIPTSDMLIHSTYSASMSTQYLDDNNAASVPNPTLNVSNPIIILNYHMEIPSTK